MSVEADRAVVTGGRELKAVVGGSEGEVRHGLGGIPELRFLSAPTRTTQPPPQRSRRRRLRLPARGRPLATCRWCRRQRRTRGIGRTRRRRRRRRGTRISCAPTRRFGASGPGSVRAVHAVPDVDGSLGGARRHARARCVVARGRHLTARLQRGALHGLRRGIEEGESAGERRYKFQGFEGRARETRARHGAYRGWQAESRRATGSVDSPPYRRRRYLRRRLPWSAGLR